MRDLMYLIGGAVGSNTNYSQNGTNGTPKKRSFIFVLNYPRKAYIEWAVMIHGTGGGTLKVTNVEKPLDLLNTIHHAIDNLEK